MVLSFREAVWRRLRLPGAHSPGGVFGEKQPNVAGGNSGSDREACAFATAAEDFRNF
jgi:hypothetical protein